MIERFTPEIFAKHCQNLGIGVFDTQNETFALMSRYEQYWSTADRFFANMNTLAVTPLPVSMRGDDVIRSLDSDIKRPVPMMRYPATFLQDPLFWSIMDFDWYLHCHSKFSEINRMRAIMSFTRKPLTLPIVHDHYLRHVQTFGTPYYGVEKGIAAYAISLVAAYSRRQMDLVRVFEILTTEPAWVATALYRYHCAIRESQEALAKMVENSALTPAFWERVGKRYEVESAKVYGDLDFEILGVCSLFELTSAVDTEYLAELYINTQWRFTDGRPWLRYIPNLYGAEGTSRHWILKEMSDICAYRENRWFAEHHYAQKGETEDAKALSQMMDNTDSTWLKFSMIGMKNPPVPEDFVDLSDFFPKNHCFNDDQYRLKPLRDIEFSFARRSIIAGEDTIPFITEEERKKIFKDIKVE